MKAQVAPTFPAPITATFLAPLDIAFLAGSASGPGLSISDARISLSLTLNSPHLVAESSGDGFNKRPQVECLEETEPTAQTAEVTD